MSKKGEIDKKLEKYQEYLKMVSDIYLKNEKYSKIAEKSQKSLIKAWKKLVLNNKDNFSEEIEKSLVNIIIEMQKKIKQ